MASNTEVVAGDRRLTALKLLAKKKRIPTDYEVPCLLVADASARTVSLAENVQRENMHPADQFAAFAAPGQGRSPHRGHCRRLRRDPLVVQRRLKLANVSPRLMADYRAGGVTLEQLMALTITDDHAAQEAAFYGAPEWQRSPSSCARRLTEREIDAAHALVRFVGLDAYRQAGGGIRRDLFEEGDAGTYLTDTAVLETLVRDKLATLAEDVRAEGLGMGGGRAASGLRGTAGVPEYPAPPPRADHPRGPPHRLAGNPPGKDRRRTGRSLRRRGRGQGREAGTAARSGGQGTARRGGCLARLCPEVREVAGAIVTIDRNGEAVIHRGLLREAEAKALRTLEKLRRGFGSTEGEADNNEGEDADDAPKAASLSDRLAQRLSAHRTAALQIEVARHPHVALAALVHGMVQTVLQPGAYGDGLPLGVRLTVQDRLEGMAPDWPESSAAVALRELQQVAGEALPKGGTELFAALVAKPQDELVRLLAVCVASTVDVVTPRATAHRPARNWRKPWASTWPHGGSRPQKATSSTFQGRDSGCRGRVCTGIRHPAGETQEGRHCQRSRAAGRWYGLDARHLQGRSAASLAGRTAGAGRRTGGAEAMADEATVALAA